MVFYNNNNKGKLKKKKNSCLVSHTNVTYNGSITVLSSSLNN